MATLDLQQLRAELDELEAAINEQSVHLQLMRHQLPWQRIALPDVQRADRSTATTRDLFGANDQLAVYHFSSTPPPLPDESRTTDPARVAKHFSDRGIQLAAIAALDSNAFDTWSQQTHWRFPCWTSATFHERFRTFAGTPAPGRAVMSLFVHHDGAVHHTYSMVAHEQGPLHAALLLSP